VLKIVIKMEAKIHGLYDKFRKGNLIVSHEGVITSELISDFLMKVEDSLSESGENVKKIRKVYNILVEALQNLFHHQASPPPDFDTGESGDVKAYSFCTIVAVSSGVYRITTGNFVRNNTAKALKERVEQLNSLSHDELKSLYKIILNNDEFTEKGGGGLGFIEMARKSGNKFGYDFVKYNDEYKFFILEVLVS
jgi:hypothetical protein